MRALRPLIERVTAISPYRRFLIGFAVAFAISLTWPISLFLECADCTDEAWRWTKHHVTYGLVHHLFFTWAVGLFLALVEPSVLRAIGKWPLLVLLGLVILAGVIAFQDFLQGELQSYQMKQPCVRLEEEHKLRSLYSRYVADPTEELKAELNREQVNYLAARKKTSLVDTLKKGNLNSVVSGLLTWLFITFCAVYIWYAAVVVWYHRKVPDKTRLVLATILLLLSVWIPSRMYVNWYQHYFLKEDIHDTPVIFAAIMALLVFGYLAAHAVITGKMGRELAVTIGGLIVACISFLLNIFPEVVSRFSAQFNKISPVQLVAICVVSSIFAIILARTGLDSRN